MTFRARLRQFAPAWIAGSILLGAGLAFLRPAHHDQRAGMTSLSSRGAPVPGQGQPPEIAPLQRGVTVKQAERVLVVDTSEEIPEFRTKELTVRAGEVIQLELRNNSLPSLHHEHGWVLVKPGATEKVGRAANSAGAEGDWIPRSEDVLARARPVGPGESTSIVFRAPDKPGDYPYLCPVTRHWSGMTGTLHVVEGNAPS